MQTAVLSRIFFLIIPLLVQQPSVFADAGGEERWIKAIANDDTEVFVALLDASGEVSTLVTLRAETGKTALMIACKTGDLSLARQLMSMGADVHAVNRTGGTPFMFASLGGHIKLIQFLHAQGVDIQARGSNGWTALTIAAAKGYDQLLAELIHMDADINVRDVYRWTPLMRAVDNHHFAAVAVLLAQDKIELNFQDESGNTALHHAALNGDKTNIVQLLQHGADRAVRNNSGFSAAQVAADAGHSAELAGLLSTE